MTVFQSLKSLSAYPIPSATLQDIAEGAGLSHDMVLTQETRVSHAYLRACAKVYLFLAEAPNVSQGGQSYSFSADERSRFIARANTLLADAGDVPVDVQCGYIGEDL